jgi:hypothetical protein
MSIAEKLRCIRFVYGDPFGDIRVKSSAIEESIVLCKQAADHIEALEAALADALSGLRYVRANYPHVTGVGFDRCEGYQSLIGADHK